PNRLSGLSLGASEVVDANRTAACRMHPDKRPLPTRQALAQRLFEGAQLSPGVGISDDPVPGMKSLSDIEHMIEITFKEGLVVDTVGQGNGKADRLTAGV